MEATVQCSLGIARPRSPSHRDMRLTDDKDNGSVISQKNQHRYRRGWTSDSMAPWERHLNNKSDSRIPAVAQVQFAAGIEDAIVLPLVLLALATKRLFQAALSILIHILDYAFPILLQFLRFPLFTARIIGDGVTKLLNGIIGCLPASGAKREAWREYVSRHWSWF